MPIVCNRYLIDSFPVENTNRFTYLRIFGNSKQTFLSILGGNNIFCCIEGSYVKESMIFHPLIIVNFGEITSAMIGKENHHYIFRFEIFLCVFKGAM